MTSSPAATRTSLLESATVFAELYGFVGGGQADDADRGGDYDVGVGNGGDCEHAFSTVMDAGQRRNIFCAQGGGELIGFLRVGHGDDAGPVALNLRD